MVVVLGQGDDVAVRGDLQPAAAGDLDVRAGELGQELGSCKQSTGEHVPPDQNSH